MGRADLAWLTSLLALSALAVPAAGQKITVEQVPALPGMGPRASLVPITGTPEMFQPGVSIANLDAGDLVAGTTWWEVEKIVYVETYVGFLWTPELGATVFEEPTNVYFNDNWAAPNEISDNGVVAGTIVFFSQFQNRPYRWTALGGLELLPQGGNAFGSAVAISADGTVIGGAVQQGFSSPTRAARWGPEGLQVLGPAGESSFVWDTSDDGAVLVGEHGPSTAAVQATRWVNGVELGLDPVPGASTSTARHVSDDGSTAVGWARVGGVTALAVWAPNGSASVHFPPNGLSIQDVAAINPSATAAVGALTDQILFQEDYVPFLWRAGLGFTLIGELGLPEDYDRSTAVDVSDDGEIVIGALQASVISNGFPPTKAFRWSASTGTEDLEALLVAAGGPPLGLFYTTAISGDGRRILATGVERSTIHDTTSVLLELTSGFGPRPVR
jgi:uncharacterized membrane protein